MCQAVRAASAMGWRTLREAEGGGDVGVVEADDADVGPGREATIADGAHGAEGEQVGGADDGGRRARGGRAGARRRRSPRRGPATAPRPRRGRPDPSSARAVEPAGRRSSPTGEPVGPAEEADPARSPARARCATAAARRRAPSTSTHEVSSGRSQTRPNDDEGHVVLEQPAAGGGRRAACRRGRSRRRARVARVCSVAGDDVVAGRARR